MANPEQVEILKQPFKIWNKWRKDNPHIELDLSGANLSSLDLIGVNLSEVDLNYANLSDTDLSGANLMSANLANADLRDIVLTNANIDDADLSGVDLRNANLSDAYLIRANLMGANLTNSNLMNANLMGANLANADLNKADLASANLLEANLSDANLKEACLSNANLTNTMLIGTMLNGANLNSALVNNADFEEAFCGFTIFADMDLSTTKGLDQITHTSPSTVGTDTLFKSKGKIPEIFLRGCGVPETLITFLPSMLEEAIQFYSCFISYSHADKEFAKRLHDRLQGVGIRCWLDEHQLNPGDKLHPTIYEAIRLYDKVILCCSETSLKSWWVEKEFENMIAKEEDYKETLLIPLSLDNYLFEQSADEWIIGEIRKKRLVQTFANWKDHDAFEQAFEKVVKALRTDGGKPPPPASKLTRRK